jgi:hypothetical protein
MLRELVAGASAVLSGVLSIMVILALIGAIPYCN